MQMEMETEMENKDIYEPYHVFVRLGALDAMQHVGSVLAPSAELAVQMGRQNFLRREQAVDLWVVPERHIYSAPAEANFFADEIDKSYRRVDGYSDNARRWKAFKQQAIRLEDIVSDVGEEEH